jgi:NRAMP (natural resistance-associated macrophage protein)-like metal ion transporter
MVSLLHVGIDTTDFRSLALRNDNDIRGELSMMNLPLDQDVSMPQSFINIIRKLGPGFITGVSDDDPSGIATYSQAGAQFGTSMLWLALFTFPLMVAVQEIAARIGRVTGHGVAGNIRRHYPPWLLYGIVALILVANTINIGADIGAMAAALEMLTGRDRFHLYPLLFGAVSLLAEIFLPYRRYSAALKWISLSVFAYVGIVLFVRIPWLQVAHDTLLPGIEPDDSYLMMLVAVLGTTISPYLFFWQSSLEVEEQRATPGEEPVKKAPHQARGQFQRIRADTFAGMAVSNLVMYFIMLTTAQTLHLHHVTDIRTTAQAAEALRPIAGPYAFTLFAMGIIGTGLLAVPVLAGSVGYAIGEALRWPTGLDRKPWQARGFYCIIAVATAVGTALNFFGVDPIRALFLTAVINGLIAVPILVVLMRMASDVRVMGRFVIPRRLALAGWLTTAAMTVAAVALVINPA